MIAHCLRDSSPMRLAVLIQMGQQRFTEDDISCSETHMRRLAKKFALKIVHPFARRVYWTITLASLHQADLTIAESKIT